MHDRPSASVTCRLRHGVRVFAAMFEGLEDQPGAIAAGVLRRFSGVISSNDVSCSSTPSCPYPILVLSVASFASTMGVSHPRGLTAPAGLRLELIDLLGGFGLGEVRLDRFVRFFGESLQIGRLRAGHLLVTRDPVIRVF